MADCRVHSLAHARNCLLHRIDPGAGAPGALAEHEIVRHDDLVVKNHGNSETFFPSCSPGCGDAVGEWVYDGRAKLCATSGADRRRVDRDDRSGGEAGPADVSAWWTVFNDPVLNTLVETAYRQNPSLRTAGVRVLEAQARRGIAIGQLFPQQQEALGTRRVTKSVRTARIGVRFSSGSSTIGKSGSTRPGNSTSGGASTAGLRLRTQNFLPQSRTTMMS